MPTSIIVNTADLHAMLGWASAVCVAGKGYEGHWLSAVEFRLGGEHADTFDKYWNRVPRRNPNALSVAATDRFRLAWASTPGVELLDGSPVKAVLALADVKALVKALPVGTKSRPCADVVRITVDGETVGFEVMASNDDTPYMTSVLTQPTHAGRFPDYPTGIVGKVSPQEDHNSTFAVDPGLLCGMLSAAKKIAPHAMFATGGEMRAMLVCPVIDDHTRTRFAGLIMPMRINR